MENKKAMPSPKRMQEELLSLIINPPVGLNVDKRSLLEDRSKLIVNIEGGLKTPFIWEKSKLQFNFPPNYPAQPPEVRFIGKLPQSQFVDQHGCVRTNLLHSKGTSTLTAERICLDIVNVLSDEGRQKVTQQLENESQFVSVIVCLAAFFMLVNTHGMSYDVYTFLLALFVGILSKLLFHHLFSKSFTLCLYELE